MWSQLSIHVDATEGEWDLFLDQIAAYVERTPEAFVTPSRVGRSSAQLRPYECQSIHANGVIPPLEEE